MERSCFAPSLIWVALVALFISGCATVPVEIQDGLYYQSKDYVVYHFRHGDTAESIAENFLGDPLKAWVIEEANQKLVPDEWVVVPLVQRNRGGVYRHGVQQVPILCYHRFGNGCSSPLCVPADIFERQMKYLRDNGYHVVSPKQLLAFLSFKEPLPKKSVMITIDDGYRSVYEIAYPILKKYGYPATLFVYTNYVGVSKKAVTWEQLRELKDDGFTIGSHTILHTDLSKQGDDESKDAYLMRLRRETVKSKQIIDRKLNQDTYLFAYPFGRANHSAVLMTRKAGYQLAVTVHRGGNAFYENPFMLHRDMILKRDMKTFKRRLKTFQRLSFR